MPRGAPTKRRGSSPVSPGSRCRRLCHPARHWQGHGGDALLQAHADTSRRRSSVLFPVPSLLADSCSNEAPGVPRTLVDVGPRCPQQRERRPAQ